MIPAGAKSLRLQVGTRFPGTFVVTIGGTSISMIPIAQIASQILYAGSISAFAGMSETLTITAPAPSFPTLNNVELDNITFSSQLVPEPSGLALWGVGCLAVALRRSVMPLRL